MRVHANAKLGPAGRLAVVKKVLEGESYRTAAQGSAVSVATVYRWVHRWLDASAVERADGRWCHDRASCPQRQPRRSSSELEASICAVRQATGWGPRLIAGATGCPHSTVWKVLKRHGLSRRLPSERGAANRYEWPRCGDLAHMDVCTYARFDRPGHRVTGDRSQRERRWMDPATRVGYDYAHALVDDHSRLAYVELHDDEKAATVTAFVERALTFFAAHGIQLRRLMTDNAFTYTKNRSLRELLAAHEIHHLTTQPYRPRTNGKVERFHQTMGREWAHGRSYPSSTHRANLLKDWLDHYNHRRPHSAINNRPPITRVHNL